MSGHPGAIPKFCRNHGSRIPPLESQRAMRARHFESLPRADFGPHRAARRPPPRARRRGLWGPAPMQLTLPPPMHPPMPHPSARAQRRPHGARGAARAKMRPRAARAQQYRAPARRDQRSDQRVLGPRGYPRDRAPRTLSRPNCLHSAGAAAWAAVRLETKTQTNGRRSRAAPCRTRDFGGHAV
jgi:hypothetical protein